MYTVTYKSKTKDATNRKLNVTVTISDGTQTFDKVFPFPLYTTREQIERVIKEYIDELDAGDTLYEALPAPDTVLDVASVTTDAPPEKQAFIDFMQDTARRERVQKLIDWGIVPANNPKVTALNDKIRTALQTNPTFLDQL